MNDKILEVYTSNKGLSPEGNRKGGTHLCFSVEFGERSALDQYQVVKSVIEVLETVRDNLEVEMVNEHNYFVAEAELAMEELFDKLGVKHDKS